MPDIVDLNRVRALKAFEQEPSIAYVEILWSEGSFGVHAAIRDLEAMRVNREPPDKPLREPETVFETQVLIDKLRWVTNYLARQWGLEERVRAEDWQGDERPIPLEQE